MDAIVATPRGQVQGTTVGQTHVFLGVPYAAPPIHTHRLGLPVPPESWAGPRLATAYGATAPQPDREVTIIPEPVVAGEDYLNLNIFTPDLGSARLPVLVWIHGGGFVAGSSASPWYRGERFARRGIVTVSLNYRLGAEGFGAFEGAPANRGLRDCLAALDWVQDNIGAFGGDPARVTLAGQSAGAAACCALLTSPMARGRFRRLIAMSGSAALVVSSNRAQRLAAGLGDRLGIVPTRAAFAAVAPAALVAAQEALPAGDEPSSNASAAGLSFVPYIDGDVIPGPPLEAMTAGVGGDVEVMIGATSQEFNVVTRRAGGDFPPERVARRLEKLGVDASRLDGYLAAHAGVEPIEIAAQAGTDALFRVNVARAAEARAGSAASTYTYEFRWESPVGNFGAAHCLDIPFAFDLLDAEGVQQVMGENPPQALADEMHASWSDFIIGGQPGWPAYDRVTRSTKVFDTPSEIRDDLHADLRAAWQVR
jgi:para-nitrobenzyl esterase